MSNVAEPKQHFITDQMLRAGPRPVDPLDPLDSLARSLCSPGHLSFVACRGRLREIITLQCIIKSKQLGTRQPEERWSLGGTPKCASDIFESVESRKSGKWKVESDGRSGWTINSAWHTQRQPAEEENTEKCI